MLNRSKCSFVVESALSGRTARALEPPHVKALSMQTRLNRLQKQLSTYQTLEVESTGLSELAGKKSVCKSRFELTTSRAGYF